MVIKNFKNGKLNIKKNIINEKNEARNSILFIIWKIKNELFWFFD